MKAIWNKPLSGILLVLLHTASVLWGASPQVVRLGYFPNVTHAQAVIGVQRGDFQAALGTEVKLETSTYNAGPSVIEAIFAGHLDMAYVGPSPTINGFIQSKGEEIRVVAGSAANGVLVVGNSKRGISKLEQLRGKKIATPQLGNTQDISAKYFVVHTLKSSLKEKGGETEVIPINNPDIEILFEKDQVDAAWVPEPWGSRLIANRLGALIAEEKDLWPEKKFVQTNIIARRRFLEDHPELVKKILCAHVKLTNEMRQDSARHADDLNNSLKRLTGKNIPRDVIVSALGYVEFTTDPVAQSYQSFYEKGRELKLLRGDALDLGKLIDTRLLNEVVASCAPAVKTDTATSPSSSAETKY
ncbi:MAG: ABC transporter substrate-binding protein [bacterium]